MDILIGIALCIIASFSHGTMLTRNTILHVPPIPKELLTTRVDGNNHFIVTTEKELIWVLKHKLEYTIRPNTLEEERIYTIETLIDHYFIRDQDYRREYKEIRQEG